MGYSSVMPVPVPGEALTGHAFTPIDYADAFAIGISAGDGQDMCALACRLFGEKASFPPYVRFLLYLRDWLVRPLGVKTAADISLERQQGEWIGFFRIMGCSGDEIILGEDDRHLDFRVSLRRSQKEGRHWLTVTTFVRFNRQVGRVYFAGIKAFHKRIVADMMNRAFGRG